MNRFLLGAALGAALIYFLDTERGEARRQRVADWSGQYINSDTMDQAKQAGQATLQQARSLTNQVSSQVSQMRSGRRSPESAATAASNSTLASTGSNM